jgi:hypothetical protein
MTPDEIRGLIDNLIVSGEQDKAMGLINDLRMYAFNPAMAGDPGGMDPYKDLVTQYDVGDYASITDVDPMRMSVQDALQKYGDAPSAVEGLIDEGGTANLDAAGNIPLSVQSEPRIYPGYTIDENKRFVYKNAPEGYIYPESETIGLDTPIAKLRSLGAKDSSIGKQRIPVTESDVLREKLAIARAGQKASDVADVGARGIGALADVVEPYVDVRDYLGRAGARVGAVKGAFKEEGIPAGLGQLFRSIGGQKYDNLKTLFGGGREIGRDAGELVKEYLVPAAGEFGTQLAYGTQDPAIVDAKNKAAMSNIEQLGSMLPDMSGSNVPIKDFFSGMPFLFGSNNNKSVMGISPNQNITKNLTNTPDINNLTTEQLNALRLQDAQDNLPIYKAAQENNAKTVVEKKATPKNVTGNSDIQAQARNDKLDQIESNIATQSAIDELRGLVGKKAGSVPKFENIMQEYKDDALSNALINLGAGIAAGDISGGLTSAGSAAMQSRREARDLRKEQILAEQAMKEQMRERDIDILSTIAQIQAEAKLSSAVTKRKNLETLTTLYEETARLADRAITDDEKQRYADQLERIKIAMAAYGVNIPKLSKFENLKKT